MDKKLDKPVETKAIAVKKYPRRSEAIKEKILREINSGPIGLREASRKYGINRESPSSWREKVAIKALSSKEGMDTLPEMTEEKKSELLQKQVVLLAKSLDLAQLKVKGLKTMIEIAEETFKIPIRKKRGSKRSIK